MARLRWLIGALNNISELLQGTNQGSGWSSYLWLSFCLIQITILPLNLLLSKLFMVDGIGSPKSHLKMYMRAMQSLGTTKEVLAQMFQNTLTKGPLRWFLNLDDERARSWKDIRLKFHKQYKCNMEVDIIRRDLETTKQELKESFSTFITKWRAKAAQMMSRPSEEEQLAIVVNNLLPIYHKY